MKYIIILVLILLFTKCLVAQHTNLDRSKEQSLFKNFVNNNEIIISLDLERVHDKCFVIQIPKKLQNERLIIKSSFLHLLNFNRNQKIILLYKPFNNIEGDRQYLNLSYEEFKVLCGKEGILEDLKGIKGLKNRRFGLNVFGEEQFFTIYLNIRNEEVEVYNYAIRSIRFSSENSVQQ